jgi:hypothetical protein
VEGGDSDTRRRAAADLVRALTGAFEQPVTALFTGYVSALLAEHAADPDRAWRSKDCAIYLVMAVTVRGRTGERGATTTNRLVDVGDFFAKQVLPELQDPNVDVRPLLKADALKFVTTFRSQLPAATLLALLGPVTALLASEHVVVHSYAAHAIERFLALREGGRTKCVSCFFVLVLFCVSRCYLCLWAARACRLQTNNPTQLQQTPPPNHQTHNKSTQTQKTKTGSPSPTCCPSRSRCSRASSPPSATRTAARTST